MLVDMVLWIIATLLIIGGIALVITGTLSGSTLQQVGGVVMALFGGALRFAAGRR